ncbi:MAG: ferrochelatase [Caulobacterales bacterium]|nr:ferrochelatase [Caulobacterales bacterium]
MARLAVVLFNLGGPSGPADVQPFLQNLFSDPAIIALPGFLRKPLARLISSRREASAQANYALMGGGSPLLGETLKQAGALQDSLADTRDDVRVFVAMRYWRPFTEDTVREVAAFAPDDVVLLPLYPQYSTTTTASSLKAWSEAYSGPGQVHTVCCYPEADGWIAAQVAAIRTEQAKAGDQPVRVLFSAHGVPESVITRRGDPYQSQVEAGAVAVAQAAGLLDWSICYQSRVGPMKWLGPSTPEALDQAARDGVGVILVPIAFVSEHIETLVELDIEYAHLARDLGVSPYLRCPTPSTEPAFIAALSDAVRGALAGPSPGPYGPGCRGRFDACPCEQSGAAA